MRPWRRWRDCGQKVAKRNMVALNGVYRAAGKTPQREIRYMKWSAGRIALAVIVAGIGAFRAGAQSKPPAYVIPPLDKIQSQPELDKAVTALDAELFDAYNTCDLAKFSSLLDDNVEFYHDQGGVTLGKEKLTQSIKDNICGGDVRRELVPGTLQIYYMKGYGAVEIGVHRFIHPKTNTPPGEGRFITLWRYENGAWKITRAISYDHHAAQANAAK
jgi:Domain of unknown function (DUF4440)